MPCGENAVCRGNTISRIEAGDTIPGVHVLARLAWGVGVTLEMDELINALRR